MARDLEVYIAGVSIEEAVEWMRATFGDVRGPIVTDGATVCYAIVGTREVPIILGDTRIRATNHISIWINASDVRWSSNAEMARAAFRRFGRQVRCDPGALGASPQTDELLVIDNAGERLERADED